jgi:hypothetical protein
MKIIVLAGILLLLAGCTWGNAVSAVGNVILWMPYQDRPGNRGRSRLN